MSNKTTKNPFELILEDMTRTKTMPSTGKASADTSSPGLSFGKLLKANNKRIDARNTATGYVDVFTVEGVGLSRAVLRNVSPGGLGIETFPVDLRPKMKIIIELGGAGAQFGRLPCTVSWVESIESHPKKHILVGLSFDNKTADFKKSFEKFIKMLSSLKR